MDRVWQERAIRSWFSMWLEGKAGDLTALFTPDVQYIESTTGTALWRSGTSKIRWMAGWRNLTGFP